MARIISAITPAKTKKRLFSKSCFVPPNFHAKKAGIKNIQTLASGFMIAPIAPPAKGPTNPTRGALISKLRRAGLSPKIIQQINHGTATKSILSIHGVMKIGGKLCKITVKGASRAAPAIFIVGLLRFIFDLPVDGFYLLNLFKSNYSLRSMIFSTKDFKEFASLLGKVWNKGLVKS